MQIRGGNMRYKTKTFQLIENYLKTCCDKCFRAHDVYDYIVANEMKVNISTVYRNLEQFVDAGQLMMFGCIVSINSLVNVMNIFIYNVKNVEKLFI